MRCRIPSVSGRRLSKKKSTLSPLSAWPSRLSGSGRESGRASFDSTHRASYENSIGPFAGRSHRPTRIPLAQTPSARLWDGRANPSPLRLGLRLFCLVLDHALQAEELGEEQQTVERKARRIAFEDRQAGLAEAEPGRQLLLRKVASLASPTDDFRDLGWVGDGLAHGRSCGGLHDQHMRRANKVNLSAPRISSNYNPGE